MISPSIRRELLLLDWNFPHASGDTFRAQHWYPGTFPPELPSALIQATTSVGDLVLDPYGGIGTSSTEALRLSRRAWLVEVNRPAALASYVSGAILLMKRCNPQMVEEVRTRIEAIIDGLAGEGILGRPADASGRNLIDEFVGRFVEPVPEDFLRDLIFSEEPNVNCLEGWYHGNTLQQIYDFRESLRREEATFVQLLGLMGLSACLKAVSSQTRSWGHIADNVRPKDLVDKDLAVNLRRWLGRLVGSLRRARVSELDPPGWEDRKWLFLSVHNWEREEPIRVAPNEQVKLLITSPPYGGAIDYVLSQRLSYYLLGASDDVLLTEQRSEIGARRQRFKDKARSIWADRLCESLKKQIRHAQASGTIIIVMPHKSEGRSNGNTIVDDTLRKQGWIKDIAIDRSIRTQRTRQAWSSIKRETINFYTAVT